MFTVGQLALSPVKRGYGIISQEQEASEATCTFPSNIPNPGRNPAEMYLLWQGQLCMLVKEEDRETETVDQTPVKLDILVTGNRLAGVVSKTKDPPAS